MAGELTLSEIGAEAQRQNPDTYGSMTGMEAASLFLEKNPNAWIHVRENDPGEQITGGHENTVGNRFSRMTGLEGLADDFSAMRNSGIPGIAIGAGLAEATARFPGNLLTEGLNTLGALRPSRIGETWEGIKTVGEGAGRAAIRAIGTRDDSMLGQAIGQEGGQEFSATGPPTSRDPSEMMAGAVVGETVDRLLDPEVWIKEPASNMLIAAGLTPTSTMPVKMAALVNAVNPAMMALRATRATAKGVKDVVTGGAKHYTGLMTGRGAEAIQEAYKSVRSADPNVRAAFYKYVRGNESLLNFHSMAQEALRTVMQNRSKNWQKIWPNLSLRRPPASVHRRVRKSVMDVLEEYDIGDVSDLNTINFDRIGIFDVAEQNVIRKWLQNIEDPSAFVNAAGELDVGSFDLLRKQTWQASRHLERDRVGRKLVERAYGKIRDVLEDNVKGGYGEMLADWKKTTDLIGDFEAASGVRAGGYLKREQLGRARISAVRNLIRALKDDPAGEAAGTIVRQMSEATGVPILPAAAGALFNNWIGSGLISRSELSGILAMGTQLHFGMNPLFIAMQLPLVSPKAIGAGIIPVLGATSRQKDAVMGLLTKIHKKIPEGWDTDGMTYFQAAQRLTEAHNIKEAQGTTVPGIR